MEDPIPQGEGAILGENVVAYSKVMGHYMRFWVKTWVGPHNHVLDGGAHP